MPAATRAPNTISSRISVTGSEVSSALLKVRSLLIACWMLASPDSAMRRSGWRACTVATAFWSAVAAWLTSATLPGTWKVTRALRSSFETSDCPPADSGLRMPAADFGRADSAAATSRAACRMLALFANVTPGARAWISTLSAKALYCAGATWFWTRSACPACPASYCGRFPEPIAWPAMKMAAISSSQPKTAVLRCLALHPATRSVTGALALRRFSRLSREV